MPKRQRDAADDVVQRSFAARPHLPRMDHLTPLGSGLKGVLVSCRMKKEISGLHEALTLLEAATAPLALAPTFPGSADQQEHARPPQGGEPTSEPSESSEPSETDRAAAKEARLQMDSSFPAVPCKTGASGLLFLRFRAVAKGDSPDHHPVELFRSVLAILDAQRAVPPVYLQRMFPVQTTCEPLLDSIAAALRALLVDIAADPASAASMLGASSTYSVMYKSRGNSSLDRNALYGAIAALMAEPGHCCGGGVSLARPTCVVMCQMIPTAHGAGASTLSENTVCALAIFPADKLTEIRGGSINVANLSGGSMEQQRQERLKRQQMHKQRQATQPRKKDKMHVSAEQLETASGTT